MKKRCLPLLLALALCVSLTTPAFALDQTIHYSEGEAEGWDDKDSGVQANYTIKNATQKLDGAIIVYGVELEGSGQESYALTNCFEGSLNTTVDVSGMENYNIGLLEKQSDGTYRYAKGGADILNYIEGHVRADADIALLESYLSTAEFKQQYEESDWLKESYPTLEDYKTEISAAYRYTLGMEYGIELDFNGYDTGSYYQFTKPGVYLISALSGSSPKYQPFEKYAAVILIGESAAPAAPVVPTAPAVPTVSPAASAVTLDGKAITLNAYLFTDANGGTTNYVMLRDVASLLSGTKSQFEVSWSQAAGIALTSGKAYTPVGGELQSKGTEPKPYTVNASTITVDGKAVELEAYTIEGNNYFKLRDLGKALGFNVTWTQTSGITVDTTVPYSETN